MSRLSLIEILYYKKIDSLTFIYTNFFMCTVEPLLKEGNIEEAENLISKFVVDVFASEVLSNAGKITIRWPWGIEKNNIKWKLSFGRAKI